MSKAKKGTYHTKETRRKISEAHKGKHFSNEHKRKIGIANKGRLFSEGHKRKLSVSHKGQNTWSKGRKVSEETKRKMSIAKRGSKCHLWKGGISRQSYPVDWTKTLKRSIRERDHYTCQICGKEPSVECHHIDYNKKNCNPNNLITLCSSCHSKTNINRKYWKEYFQKVTKEDNNVTAR